MLDAWIKLICGKPGHGKSLLAAKIMAEVNILTLTNMELTPAHPRYNEIVRVGDDDKYPLAREDGAGIWDWCPPDCLLVWDEIDIDLDASDHSKMGKKAKAWFKQHRKHDVRVLGIVQDVSNVWVRLRRVTQSYVWCVHDAKIPDSISPFLPLNWSRWCRREYTQPDLNESSLVRSDFDWYGDLVPVFDWYNSRQIIRTTTDSK